MRAWTYELNLLLSSWWRHRLYFTWCREARNHGGGTNILAISLWDIHLWSLWDICIYSEGQKYSYATLRRDVHSTRKFLFINERGRGYSKEFLNYVILGFFFSINLFLQWFLEYIQISKFICYWLIHEWIFFRRKIHYSSL